jgi:hypothetical protein
MIRLEEVVRGLRASVGNPAWRLWERGHGGKNLSFCMHLSLEINSLRYRSIKKVARFQTWWILQNWYLDQYTSNVSPWFSLISILLKISSHFIDSKLNPGRSLGLSTNWVETMHDSSWNAGSNVQGLLNKTIEQPLLIFLRWPEHSSLIIFWKTNIPGIETLAHFAYPEQRKACLVPTYNTLTWQSSQAPTYRELNAIFFRRLAWPIRS